MDLHVTGLTIERLKENMAEPLFCLKKYIARLDWGKHVFKLKIFSTTNKMIIGIVFRVTMKNFKCRPRRLSASLSASLDITPSSIRHNCSCHTQPHPIIRLKINLTIQYYAN